MKNSMKTIGLGKLIARHNEKIMYQQQRGCKNFGEGT